MEQLTVEQMLNDIQREINLLRSENLFGGYDYESYRQMKECDRLIKLYEEIAYFQKEYC